MARSYPPEFRRKVLNLLAERFPDAAAMLEAAGPDILAFTAFPQAH